MTHEQLFLAAMGVLFLGLQLVYVMVTKTATKEILTAITDTIGKFTSHLEESTEIHDLVRSLAKAHDVHDQDGRPMWYMPRSVLDTQGEITKIMHTVAQTQKTLARLMEQNKDKITEHSDSCKERNTEIKSMLTTIIEGN